MARTQPEYFLKRQIELLKTFADQAVIAIENVRLFEAEQARTRELTQSLEQQTATAEILRVISSSPTEVQPVFDAIVRSASSLCGGEHAIVTRYDGELLHLAAQHNPRPGADDETVKFFPQAPRREASISGRALLDAAVVHLSDIETEQLEPSARDAYRRMRLRAVISVPMVHEGRPIGVISVSRASAQFAAGYSEVRPDPGSTKSLAKHGRTIHLGPLRTRPVRLVTSPLLDALR